MFYYDIELYGVGHIIKDHSDSSWLGQVRSGQVTSGHVRSGQSV